MHIKNNSPTRRLSEEWLYGLIRKEKGKIVRNFRPILLNRVKDDAQMFKTTSIHRVKTIGLGDIQ